MPEGYTPPNCFRLNCPLNYPPEWWPHPRCPMGISRQTVARYTVPLFTHLNCGLIHDARGVHPTKLLQVKLSLKFPTWMVASSTMPDGYNPPNCCRLNYPFKLPTWTVASSMMPDGYTPPNCCRLNYPFKLPTWTVASSTMPVGYAPHQTAAG